MVSTRKGLLTQKKKAPPTRPSTPRQSTVKKKNLVVATTATKPSPFLSPSTKNKTAGDDDDDSQASDTSSTASCPGLPLHIQKQLATDIEEAGGIKAFYGKNQQALYRLCNKNLDLYGKRGDNLRKQLQKKVHRWCLLERRGTYTEKVLNRYGLKSFDSLRAEERRAACESELSDNDSSENSSESSSDESSRVSKKPAEKSRPPPTIETTTEVSPPSPVVPTRTAKMDSRKLLPRDTWTIDVNINCPEKNREVMIYPIANIEGVIKAEDRYHGYSIHLPFDPRWSIEDDSIEHYSGRVWKEDAVLLRIPAFPFTPLRLRDEVNRCMPANIVDAMDDARHEFESNKVHRQWKYLLLQFPPGHAISSKAIFREAGDDEELDFELAEVAIPVEGGYRQFPENWMHFRVARTDLRVSKRGRVEIRERKSKMAAKLEARRAFEEAERAREEARRTALHISGGGRGSVNDDVEDLGMEEDGA